MTKPQPPDADAALAVSAGNPCPFLRALVASGRLADGTEPLGRVADVIVETAKAGDGSPVLPAAAIGAIALIANGVGPLSLLRARREGLKLDALRGGPLDKRGAGSGLLDQRGHFDAAQFARLREFASDQPTAAGGTAPGLRLADLRRYMDANFERAKGRRRAIDRALMNGEWPVLLKVLGQDGPKGRYLSLADVERLFKTRRLPARVSARLKRAPAGPLR